MNATASTGPGNGPRPTVLLVEDEASIRRFVRLAAEAESCTVIEAATLAAAGTAAAAHPPDLVILDLGLPDGDGMTFLHTLRRWSSAPTLVLSARGLETDKINALDAGADDYLTKPFGVGELRARLRALLRRRPEELPQPLLAFGEVVVDLVQRQVLRAGQPVHLTPTEYRLLCVLIARPGKVLTQRALLREVWGPGSAERSHYLRVYVRQLRQKLERDPTLPQHLLTETGVGYRFQP